jgi:hypothetical protein
VVHGGNCKLSEGRKFSHFVQYVMSRKNVQQTFMVLLFRRWLVKSSVDVYLTFNILQILLSIFEFIPQTMELLFSGRLVKSAEVVPFTLRSISFNALEYFSKSLLPLLGFGSSQFTSHRIRGRSDPLCHL